MDTIRAIRDQIKTLGVNDSDAYGSYGGYYGGYNTNYYGNRYEFDSKVDKLMDMFDDLEKDIEEQLSNEISWQELKLLMDGIHKVLINQFQEGNMKKFRKWHYNSSVQTVYHGSMKDYWDRWFDWEGETKVTKPFTKSVSKTTYTSRYTARPSKKLKWNVIIRPEVSTFIKQMMRDNKGMEWGVAFSWIMNKEEKQIIIDKIYIMPVDIGGAHVKFANESEFVIFQDLSELPQFVSDVYKEGRYAGIMHSHHGMGSWHSGIDMSTIDTYVQDFKSVLSMVWAWSGGTSPLTVDVILKSDTDGYLIPTNQVIHEQELEIESEELQSIDNDYVNSYNNMIEIVKRDYDKYKKILEMFDKTKKYIPISELYKQLTNDELTTIDKEIINQLIKL